MTNPGDDVFGIDWKETLGWQRNRLLAAEDSTRSRLGTLSSLLLGLSLLALQVEEPEGTWLIIGSWIVLGVATLFSAVRELIETRWVRTSYPGILRLHQ